MSTQTFSRPGVVVSLFIPTPPDANAINVHEANFSALEPAKLAEAVVSLWSATSCAEAVPEFVAAFNIKDISRLPAHKVVDTKQLQCLLQQAEVGESLLATASGRLATTHQAILQRQSDALSLRCNWCPEKTDDDLSTAVQWAGELIAEAKRLPVFGMTCIYYFEFQDTDLANRQQELDAFAKSIQSKLELSEHQSSKVCLAGGSLLLSRIQSPSNVGTLGGLQNIFVAGIDKEQNHLNAFIAQFYRTNNYHQVPPGALYALALEKIYVHRHKAIQANLSARENGKAIFAQLNLAAKEIENGQNTNLADIAGKLEELEDQMLLVREVQTTINLNIELVADRTVKAFGVDIALRHYLPAFIREDLTLARQAQLQVGGFVDYLHLMSGRFYNRVNFMRTQLEALIEKRQRLEFESHERLIERFHLLEVFIVTVYVLELPHIYEQLKEMGLVLALISSIVVLFFIFGRPNFRLQSHGHQHRSGQGWSLRTVFVCALLITLPYLWSNEVIKKVWSSLTGLESKTIESAPKPKDHSK